MKKIITLLTTTALILTTALGFTVSAYAQEISEDECDTCFRETMAELLTAEAYGDTVIHAQKQMIYDIYTNPLGFVYDFEANGENGFAVVIYDETVGAYAASEVYLQGENPYRDCEGTEIYVAPMIFWELADEGYYDRLSGEQVPAEVVENATEYAFTNTYEGGVTHTMAAVTVVYASKSEDVYKMSLSYPSFLGDGTVINGCAAIAGGNLLGYFDRYCDELIPNYTAGTTLAGYYLYSTGETDEVRAAINTLYSYMGISAAGGATLASFRSGMARYCNEKGRNISFASCMVGGKFSYAVAVQKMKAGYPVALFLSYFHIGELQEIDSTDYYQYKNYTVSHAMVAFGSREITYTLSDGTTQVYQLLAVSTGLSDASTGYFNVNYYTNIDDSYAINIY